MSSDRLEQGGHCRIWRLRLESQQTVLKGGQDKRTHHGIWAFFRGKPPGVRFRS